MQEKISALYLRRFSLIERYRRPASGIPKQSAETFLLKMPVVGQYLGQALPPHGLPPPETRLFARNSLPNPASPSRATTARGVDDSVQRRGPAECKSTDVRTILRAGQSRPIECVRKNGLHTSLFGWP